MREGSGRVPLRIGIDLVCADEVRDSIARHGSRYMDSVYTEAEQHDCGRNPARLAARFAAKEAVMKALGCTDRQLPWRSIGVVAGADGRPAVELSGEAAALGRRLGLARISLALAHQRSQGAAIVLAQLQEGR